jgi:hypothetical protein
MKKVRSAFDAPHLIRDDSIIHEDFDDWRSNRASLANGNVCLTKYQQETS